MRRLQRLASLTIACLGLFAIATRAQAQSAATTQPTLDDVPYTVEESGHDEARVGGGARAEGGGPTIFLLVAQRPGKTVKSNPTLYWYLTEDTDADLDIVISRPNQVEPVVKRTLTGHKKAGIGSLDLTDEKELTEGAQHKVTAYLWLDRGNTGGNGSNPFSAGFLTRVPVPADLAAAGAGPDQFAFARAKLWYDAVDAVSKKITASPADVHLRRQRVSLLEKEHVFLTFSPPADQLNVPGVKAAAQSAALAEKEMLRRVADGENAGVAQ